MNKNQVVYKTPCSSTLCRHPFSVCTKRWWIRKWREDVRILEKNYGANHGNCNFWPFQKHSTSKRTEIFCAWHAGLRRSLHDTFSVCLDLEFNNDSKHCFKYRLSCKHVTVLSEILLFGPISIEFLNISDGQKCNVKLSVSDCNLKHFEFLIPWAFCLCFKTK